MDASPFCFSLDRRLCFSRLREILKSSEMLGEIQATQVDNIKSFIASIFYPDIPSSNKAQSWGKFTELKQELWTLPNTSHIIARQIVAYLLSCSSEKINS